MWEWDGLCTEIEITSHFIEIKFNVNNKVWTEGSEMKHEEWSQ